MSVPKRCKCGNYMGDDTPAKGKMCMECWLAAKNKPAGIQQCETPPDRPGNPLATLDIPEYITPRSFAARMATYMRMLRYDDINND